MKKENNTTFFEAVAAHNLERFHSETIAWLFNSYPNTAKYFIVEIHDEVKNISDISFEMENGFCWAEQNQIDILLKYSFNKKNYKIIVENKIKASEHQIDIDRLKINVNDKKVKKILTKKELKFITINKGNKMNRKISQTEFYYLREKLYRSN